MKKVMISIILISSITFLELTKEREHNKIKQLLMKYRYDFQKICTNIIGRVVNDIESIFTEIIQEKTCLRILFSMDSNKINVYVVF